MDRSELVGQLSKAIIVRSDASLLQPACITWYSGGKSRIGAIYKKGDKYYLRLALYPRANQRTFNLFLAEGRKRRRRRTTGKVSLYCTVLIFCLMWKSLIYCIDFLRLFRSSSILDAFFLGLRCRSLRDQNIMKTQLFLIIGYFLLDRYIVIIIKKKTMHKLQTLLKRTHKSVQDG